MGYKGFSPKIINSGRYICSLHRSVLFIYLFYWCVQLGPKSQKVPMHKMVRTDSSDPAGRLHAYLQTKPHNHLAEKSSLSAVR